MRASTKAAGLEGVTWHALRHHHASMLLSAGVSPALVAERLGHDLQTLLRTYSHVIRSDEDRVRAIVDDALGGSAEDWLRTDVPTAGKAG
jgi:site-specific recombinase XerD